MDSKLSRYCTYVIEAGWVGAVIVTALYFNVYSSRIFEPDKITLLRSIALLILIAWVVKVVDRKEYLQWGNDIKRVLRYPLILPVLLFVFSYSISTIFSIVPVTSFVGSYQRLQGTYTAFSYLIIFFSIIYNLKDKENASRLITVMISVSLPIAMYGLLQRYKIDPIPWGGDVSARIASSMGNSIFVAAYLIMVFPLTLIRIIRSMQELNSEQGSTLPVFLRATLYIFILILQIVALYFSGSRGPALGWLNSILFFVLIYSWWRRKRLVGLCVICLTLLFGIFLLVFNLPQSPLEALKSNPAVGRFGQLLDPQSNNAKVRTYIWQGASKLVGSHPPLEFPDGKTDRFNFLRPIIGYGPESMYVAYNRFYPPELTQVEKRNASPDRSHNETWDSLVITGIIGFIVYIFLFLQIFKIGFEYVGLLETKTDKQWFYVLEIGLGILFTIGFILWRGVEYLGIAFPLGMVTGLFILLAQKIIFQSTVKDAKIAHSEKSLTIIAIMAVFIAHLIEINFGIAIAVTRTYFWVLCGILVVLVMESKIEQIEKLKEPATAVLSSERKRKKRQDFGIMKTHTMGEIQFSQYIGLSGVIGLILIVLGYNFLSASQLGSSPIQIIWASLTKLKADSTTSSYGILLLALMSAIIPTILFTSEQEQVRNRLDFFRACVYVSGSGILIAGLYWFIHATALSSLVATQVNTVGEILLRVKQYENLLSIFYAALFLLLLLLAGGIFLSVDRAAHLPSAKASGWISLIIGGLIWILIIGKSNMQVIKADIAFKMAESFAKQETWPVSIEIYKHAIELAPREDYYYLFLGRAYLEQGKTLGDAGERDQFFTQAEADLLMAQKLNPLNTDHTANLARLYSLWSLYSSDEKSKQERFQKSNSYFEKAVSLSPNNARLWDEWAVLQMGDDRHYSEAMPLLLRAYELDPSYDWTVYLLGEYYAKEAQMKEGQEKNDAVQKALSNYLKAASLTNDVSLKVNYLLNLAQFSIKENQIVPAISALEEVLSYVPNGSESWKYENLLAQLYREMGKLDLALLHAQRALTLSPDDQRQKIEEFIKNLEQ